MAESEVKITIKVNMIGYTTRVIDNINKFKNIANLWIPASYTQRVQTSMYYVTV